MPERKTTPHQQRRAERQIAKVTGALELLGKLADPAVMLDLVARVEQPSAPDGYPNGSGGGGSKSADETTSVERAVLALTGYQMPDPIKRAGERLFRDLAQIQSLANDAVRQRDVILMTHVVTERVNSIPSCQACRRDVLPKDGQLRGGYCVACRKDWDRYGSEVGLGQRDRAEFERRRRQRVEAVA